VEVDDDAVKVFTIPGFARYQELTLYVLSTKVPVIMKAEFANNFSNEVSVLL
jgi:hypothetical protein